MKEHPVTWPCGDVPFEDTIRADLYGKQLFSEYILWLAWIALPTALVILGVLSDVSLRKDLPSPLLLEVLAAVVLLLALSSAWCGRRFVWGSVSRSHRLAGQVTAEWRRSFEEARKQTEELCSRISPTDRSKDASLRGAAWAAMRGRFRCVYNLSAAADVSFSPRSFAGSTLRGKRLQEILAGQLVLELLRLGGQPVLVRDTEDNIITIWQLEKSVQFWAIVKVEPIGAEVRLSERTGYQWWMPWKSNSRLFGSSVDRKARSVTKALFDDMEIPWHLSSLPTLPIAAICCTFLSLLLPPLGFACWGVHALKRARAHKRFAHWHALELGDSLDLALLQNERSLRPLRYVGWRVENIVNEDGTPAFPDILQRIETMRELVGAAVTQAIEETVNLAA